MVSLVVPAAPPERQIDREKVDAIRLPDKDPRAALLGWWEQVGPENDPDFGPGGYSRAYLSFRSDGVLGVIRVYGPAGEFRHDLAIGYTVHMDGAIVLGEDPDHRPDPTPFDYDVPVGAKGETARILKPALALPARVQYSITGDELRVGTKSYRRASAPVR